MLPWELTGFWGRVRGVLLGHLSSSGEPRKGDLYRVDRARDVECPCCAERMCTFCTNLALGTDVAPASGSPVSVFTQEEPWPEVSGALGLFLRRPSLGWGGRLLQSALSHGQGRTFKEPHRASTTSQAAVVPGLLAPPVALGGLGMLRKYEEL